MTVKPGCGRDFEHKWAAIAEQIREFPGNLRQALARDLEDPNSFVVTSDWSDLEAFRSFESSREQDDVTTPLRELRTSARMTVHEIVSDVEGRGT